MKQTYTAALLDDDREILPYLAEKIQTEFLKHKITLQLAQYQSPASFLEALEKGNQSDIYFLDIDMSQVNGLTVAKKIGDLQKDAILIFLSAKEDLVFSTFRLHPFFFIRKSHFPEDLRQAVEDLKGAPEAREECLLTDEQGQPISLSLDKTLYLEASDKYIDIVTQEGRRFIRRTLSYAEKVLTDYGFVRIHRSYLVNLRSVYAIKYDKVILDNGASLPLSRGKAAELKRRFCRED